jgi:hypothetical protein
MTVFVPNVSYEKLAPGLLEGIITRVHKIIVSQEGTNTIFTSNITQQLILDVLHFNAWQQLWLQRLQWQKSVQFYLLIRMVFPL